MPDITMCNGEGCPAKESCYRFTAKPSSFMQSYFLEPPIKDGKCDEYWGDDYVWDKQKKLLIEVMEADEKDGLYKTNNMAQQTAVDWLVKKYFDDYNVLIPELEYEQAKQMEKEQHKKTWDAAYKAAKDDIVSDRASTFENYYGKSNS
jgi:hypothetical protein